MVDRRKIIVILKGYPRLSETFIAQELLGLEKAGFALELVSMRWPTDTKRHPVHHEIKAPVRYLPEYLYQEPIRVLRGLGHAMARASFWRLMPTFLAHLARDRTPNRLRRLGQAVVLAREWPADAGWLHAHFIHTPGSVAFYASRLLGIPWTCSAHAKDIWTTPDRELTAKLADARWVVTCTKSGHDHLAHLAPEPDRVHLSYHGLDLARFGPNPAPGSSRDGSDAAGPVRILSVGRAVDKKGYDVLLDALAALPRDLHWRFEHIGGGEHLKVLKEQAARLGIADRISWKGALAQEDVLTHYRSADIFVLACRVSADGDRDGLPNVLVEASSQALVCLSTNVSGVPELLEDGANGRVVPPEDASSLAGALTALIRDPAERARLGRAAEARVRSRFDFHMSIRQLTHLFESEWEKP